VYGLFFIAVEFIELGEFLGVQFDFDLVFLGIYGGFKVDFSVCVL